MKRKHLFKKRYSIVNNYSYKLNWGKSSVCSLKKQRFNFVYIRFIKKLFRRSYCKVKMRFFKPKIWLKIRANYICSQKSKNARMGAGVGKFVRLVSQLLFGLAIMELKYFSFFQVKKAVNYLKFKCGLSLFVKFLFIF